VGGDLYPYFFPQKTFLAKSLEQGEIPKWNPLVGFGYPVIAESQTAALYPPNLLAYSFLDVNTAYNTVQMAHYIFAFFSTWGLLRQLGIRQSGALIGATALVYGWFPPKICLEWAIIGGAWFSVILWSATHYLQSGRLRSWMFIAIFLAMDLLAGHFHLAFITLLALLPLPWMTGTVDARPWAGWKRTMKMWIAVCIGFTMASVQLLPTLELKQLSQRQEENEAFSPTYGHLPPLAFSQLISPQSWHGPEIDTDAKLQASRTLAVPDATNKVEAHLYVGLSGVVLVLLGLLVPSLRQQYKNRPLIRWWLFAIAGALLATGWPTYYLSNLPGIGFFRGPGRYSLLTALAFAVLAATAWDALWQRWKVNSITISTITAIVLTITVGDLWAVSREYAFGPPEFYGRQVFYSVILDEPVVEFANESQFADAIDGTNPRTRIYAPGANITTILGCSTLPVYLGLGPAIYETDRLRADFTLTDPAQVKLQRKQLNDNGVTHLLMEHQLDAELWNLETLGPIRDPFLNRVLARREPFYVYQIKDAVSPISLNDPDAGTILDVIQTANEITVEVNANSATKLIVRHLNYPGWNTILDGKQVATNNTDDLFRTVSIPPGTHTVEWKYQPTSFKYGSWFSLFGGIVLCLLSFRFRKLIEESSHQSSQT